MSTASVHEYFPQINVGHFVGLKFEVSVEAKRVIFLYSNHFYKHCTRAIYLYIYWCPFIDFKEICDWKSLWKHASFVNGNIDKHFSAWMSMCMQSVVHYLPRPSLWVVKAWSPNPRWCFCFLWYPSSEIWTKINIFHVQKKVRE